jgi:hypothetical protein
MLASVTLNPEGTRMSSTFRRVAVATVLLGSTLAVPRQAFAQG